MLRRNGKMVNRRQFLTGAAIAAVGATAVSSMAGCASGSSSGEQGEQASVDISPSETISADIVVVGGGVSGLSASVQAAQLGAKVVLLESEGKLGGNGYGTEGIFAVGSSMQQEQGINLTLSDIVSSEQDFFKYKVNALFWKDMISASAENIEWLMENGVEFEGVVDDYMGIGRVATMHWWKDGDGASYIEPMAAKAEELGVDIRLNVRGEQVIKDGDRVVGVYAKNASDEYIQVDAKAVIVATGGFADNVERLEESAGISADQVYVHSFGGHNGDGIDIAIQAGAKDLTATTSFLRETTLEESEYNSTLFTFWFTHGNYLWVNQEGERFADENCVAITSGCMSNAASNQDQPYGIVSRAIIDEAGADVSEQLQSILDAGSDYVIEADTVEEIAEKFSIDSGSLSDTLSRYNDFCSAGKDDDFGKDASALVKLDPPFVGVKFKYCYMSSLGGIKTTRHAEVVHADGSVIPGLYAVGGDGCQLYGGTYTISVCGSFNGNNVYSGRNAANNAWEYING